MLNQGIWARSDNPNEVKQNKMSQHREYNCLNLKKCDEQMNKRTNIQTDLCIELRYAQLIMLNLSILALLQSSQCDCCLLCYGRACV